MKQIIDRVAVVTGAGSGIGRAVSLELAAQGADLALVDIDESALKAVQAAVEATGRKASLHLVDVSSRSRWRYYPSR
jgi:meso-butanediol dehydrogenase/(S,S)-butanediol dehydrogenase/diacetyl reductase